MNLTELLTSIANAIRAKKGTTASINAQDFPTEIASIPKGSGNAGVGDVLNGKTFSNSDGEQVGTMPNRGAVSQTIAPGGSYTIPLGYHNGNGKVTASPATHSCTQLALGTVDVSKYNFIIFSHGGWGTDNGTGGSTTFKVSGGYSYSRTISHGNSCNRSTCGGHYTTVIDNTSKKYKTLTFSYSVSGADIWGGYSIHGII